MVMPVMASELITDGGVLAHGLIRAVMMISLVIHEVSDREQGRYEGK